MYHFLLYVWQRKTVAGFDSERVFLCSPVCILLHSHWFKVAPSFKSIPIYYYSRTFGWILKLTVSALWKTCVRQSCRTGGNFCSYACLWMRARWWYHVLAYQHASPYTTYASFPFQISLFVLFSLSLSLPVTVTEVTTHEFYFGLISVIS